MSALSIQPTYPILTDIDGQPLENGFVWVGTANLDPQANPITAYWDAALTQVATQPVRTRGGYPLNGTSVGRLYVNSDYSILVQNRNGATVYSAPAATERYGNIIIISAADVSYLPAGTGAVATTVQAKLRESVSVLDFGADPTGVADSSAAFNAARAVGRNIYAPAGTYKISISLDSNECIYGDGFRRTVLIPSTGAPHVILIDASSTAKQNISLSDLCFKNPNNVANCSAIWFAGNDVNDINDQHNLTNLEVGPSGWEGPSYPFIHGIYVTGRLIALTATNVYLSKNTVNWRSTTDSSTPAFNANVFIQCVFAEASLQGFLHTGQSTNVKFLGGYTQGNNTSNTVSCAGMDISDVINWDIDTHGFEANGFGVPVNTTVPTSNGISLLVQGTICQNLCVHGGYFTSSGANIVIGSTVSILSGGRIDSNYLNCLTGGFNFATLSQSGSNSQTTPIIFSSTNNYNGKISIYSSGIGINAAPEQNQGMGYLTTDTPIDLLKTCNFTCNPGSTPFTLTSIANMIPGCELLIANRIGSASVTIDSSYMQAGGGSGVVATGTIAKFKVLGGPYPGLFYRLY